MDFAEILKEENGGMTSSKDQSSYNADDIVDSDVEDDRVAYLQFVKAVGCVREEVGGTMDEESSDESYVPEESGSEVAEEYDSNPPTSSDSEDDDDASYKGSDEDFGDGERKVKEKKPKEVEKSESAKTVVGTAFPLKSAGDALTMLKKMVPAVYRIPIKLAGIWIRCNLKMVKLVVGSCLLMISDVLLSAFPFKFSKEKRKDPEATGNTADNEEAVQLDELRNAVTGSIEGFQEALNTIVGMIESFREERKAIFEPFKEFKIDEIIEAIKENVCEKHAIEEAELEQISNLSRGREALDMDVCYGQLNDNWKNITSRAENDDPKNKLNATNIKSQLEQILRVSPNLIEELNKLNHEVCHLAEVSDRMAAWHCRSTALLDVLGAGRKFLSEVEAGRNEMKRKLETLQRLIKEEVGVWTHFLTNPGLKKMRYQLLSDLQD